MMDPRIKFRHIQSFVEIARQGSLKAAAEMLSLTQPAISRTLKELEEILGTSLMLRSRAGITLTAEGAAFLHFARMSLAALSQGLDGIERAGLEAAERLTVGSLPSVAGALMPDVAREVRARRPGAVLQIVDGPHVYLVDQLRLGALDVVIGRLGEPETMQGISFTQLYLEEVAFVVRAGHPLLDDPNPQRLPDWPVIFPPAKAAIRPLVDRWLIAQGIGQIPDRIETVSGAFGRIHARTTDAVWIISGGVVAAELADGVLARLPFDTSLTSGPVGLMTRPDMARTEIVEVFQRAVTAVIDRRGDS
ncbi:MAG: pca operon transcription factor PcaQ [Pseudomonadota bacterium]